MAARERGLAVLAKQLAKSDVDQNVREEYTQKFVMYGSTQCHSLGIKAAILLGIKWHAVEVREEDGYSMRGVALDQAIREDIEQGYTPLFISEWHHFMGWI